MNACTCFGCIIPCLYPCLHLPANASYTLLSPTHGVYAVCLWGSGHTILYPIKYVDTNALIYIIVTCVLIFLPYLSISIIPVHNQMMLIHTWHAHTHTHRQKQNQSRSYQKRYGSHHDPPCIYYGHAHTLFKLCMCRK